MLDIIDTGGQEDYSALRDQYMRISKGFILVYSITSRSTFDEIFIFREQVMRVKGVDDYYPIVLVGNKCNLENERLVTKKEGEEVAKNWNCPFFESSAFNGINIENCFFELVREMTKYHQKIPTQSNKKSKCVFF